MREGRDVRHVVDGDDFHPAFLRDAVEDSSYSTKPIDSDPDGHNALSLLVRTGFSVHDENGAMGCLISWRLRRSVHSDHDSLHGGIVHK